MFRKLAEINLKSIQNHNYFSANNYFSELKPIIFVVFFCIQLKYSDCFMVLLCRLRLISDPGAQNQSKGSIVMKAELMIFPLMYGLDNI